MRELRGRFERGENIMAWFKERAGVERNTLESVEAAYDLQTGSYTAALARPEFAELKMRRMAGMAEFLRERGVRSLLDAGTGEATSLQALLRQGPDFPDGVRAFDLSLSRILQARRVLEEAGFGGVGLCTGELQALPFADSSIDAVVTVAAIEPNGGQERECLRELIRVAARYVILLEPSTEFSDEVSLKAIEERGYVRDLRRVAEEEGVRILRHEAAERPESQVVQYGLLILEKSEVASSGEVEWGCPICHGKLRRVNGGWYCDEDCLVYPEIEGVACLRSGQGVLASFLSEKE